MGLIFLSIFSVWGFSYLGFSLSEVCLNLARPPPGTGRFMTKVSASAAGGVAAGVPTGDTHDDAGDDHFCSLLQWVNSFCDYIIAEPAVSPYRKRKDFCHRQGQKITKMKVFALLN